MERLITAILRAAELHERSYNHEKSAKLEKEGKIAPDFHTCYELPLQEACDKAAEEVGFDERGTEPIYLLLKNSWNDSIAWAEKYKEK